MKREENGRKSEGMRLNEGVGVLNVSGRGYASLMTRRVPDDGPSQL